MEEKRQKFEAKNLSKSNEDDTREVELPIETGTWKLEMLGEVIVEIQVSAKRRKTGEHTVELSKLKK